MLLKLAQGIIIALAGIGCYASTDTPEQFLRGILDSDLAGDASPRLNRVGFSTADAAANYAKEKNTSDILPEAFTLDFSPIVVVKNYSINSMTSSADKFCLSVDFKVTARSIGQGLPSWSSNERRELRSTRYSDSEKVNYCATRKDNQFILLDPPVPRVNEDVVITFLRNEVASSDRRIKKIKSADPRAQKTLRVIKEAFEAQLSALCEIPNPSIRCRE